jgi:S-DNA-T family DNA segregation ATPase FtsK/SpoIIIE
MSDLSIQQIMNSRYRTSTDADRITVALMSSLGLSTKANVARLAIGRSLALGALTVDGVDSKGLEIPAAVLFTQEDITAWVGLIVAHAKMHGNEKLDSMDAFRASVRKHWHRGATLLMEDWKGSNGNFDKFLETLIIRRAELPDVAASNGGKTIHTSHEIEKPKDNSVQLLKALADIGVAVEVKGHIHGPRVTRYKVLLSDVNHLDKLYRGLERLSLSLNLQGAQPTVTHGDEANTVNIDVPRPQSTWHAVVFSKLREWAASTPIDDEKLMVFPGVNALGNPYSFDLAAAPHLLVGGTTGSGKSVCLHSLILSMVLRMPPTMLKLALIDPKQVEFAPYQNSKYLYGDIATDAATARECILELVVEMEARYQSFKSSGVTNIYEARKKGLSLPYVVVFIEELADLLMQDKEIEDHIIRLAQKARAAGIHLVIATQRPDAKTFSGLIRSNIPARIALTVQKSTESNIILDESGAELLLGAGDMLVKAKPGGQAERVHGVRATRGDIEAVLKERSARKH